APSRGSDQFMLRMPEGMRDHLRVIAEARGVSMNTLIVDALEEAFPATPTLEVLAEQLRYLMAAAEVDPTNERLLSELADSLGHRPSPAALKRPRYDDGRVLGAFDKHGVTTAGGSSRRKK